MYPELFVFLFGLVLNKFQNIVGMDDGNGWGRILCRSSSITVEFNGPFSMYAIYCIWHFIGSTKYIISKSKKSPYISSRFILILYWTLFHNECICYNGLYNYVLLSHERKLSKDIREVYGVC